MFKFGHFSDIHYQFSDFNYDTETMRAQLIDKLSEFAPLNALFITGDIFNKGNTGSEQEQAVTKFISEMADAAGCELSHVYICAGNHDLKRSRARADNLKSIIDIYKENNFTGLSTVEYAPIIYENVVIPFNKICERITNNSDPKEIHRFIQLDDINLIILNTSTFAGQTFPGQENKDDSLENTNLFICDEKFHEFENEAKKFIDKNKLTICLGHHSPECFEKHEKARFINYLNRVNCDFYLCGHIHTISTKVIENTYATYQITCGGPFKDKKDYNFPSFIIGEFDPETYFIKASLFYYVNSWQLYTQALPPWSGGILNRPIDRIKKLLAEKLQSEQQQVLDFHSVAPNVRIEENNANSMTFGITQCKPKTSTLRGHKAPDISRLNLIPRYIVPNDGSIDGNNNSSLSMPFEYLKQEKHIVLLASAGQGKTCTLSQICQEAYDQGYHPFFFQLQTLADNNALSLVAQGNAEIDDKIVFVLDGFDEISDDQKDQLIHTVKNVKSLFPNIPIVISSRKNAYSEQFEGFKSCTIKTITSNEISQFLHNFGIDVTSWDAEIAQKDLEDLVCNVFFLSSLITLWKRNGCLPDKSQVMKELIDMRINEDINHIYSQSPLQRQKQADIRKAFETIALIMQCMHRYYLTIEEIKCILDDKIMEILDCHGLWYQNEEGCWCFIHNNYREYLSAEALSYMDFNHILEFISNKPISETIKPSWINTLTYLINIYPSDDLRKWICENQPELVPLFEEDRFTETQRTEILQFIVNKHKDQNSWIDPNYSFLPDLIDFCSTRDSVLFLIKELQSDQTPRHKQNLLRCLTYFPSYYEHTEALKELIHSIAFDTAIDINIRCDAFRLMAHQPVLFDEFIVDAANCSIEEKDENLLYSIILFIQRTGKSEEYIDIFINVYDGYDYHKNKLISLKLLSYSTLINIQGLDAACKILRCIPRWSRSYSKSNSDTVNLFSKCCELGIQHFTGDKDLFLSELVSIPLSKIVNPPIFAILKNYIEKTQTEREFIVNIIQHQPIIPHRGYILSQLISESMINTIEDMFFSNDIDNPTVENLIRRLPYNSSYQLRLIRAFCHKTGEQIKVDPPVDNGKELQAGRQLFFDSLFDENLFDSLVENVISTLGEEATICDESSRILLSISSSQTNEALYECYRSLQEVMPEGEKITIKDYKKYINNRDHFRLSNAAHCLQHYSIVITEEKRESLTVLCIHYLENEDFLGQITIDNNQLSFSKYLYAVTTIIRHLSVSCSEDLAIKLLMIPSSLFGYNDYDQLPECITNQLSSDMLKQFVLDQIHGKKWNRFTAPALIHYCEENRITECKSEIIQYVLDDQINSGYTYQALQCLKELHGINCILEDVLPECQSTELLSSLSAVIPNETAAPLLDQKLWEAYKQTSDLHWLKILINHNNVEALIEYLSLANKRMSLPDMVDEPRVPELTEAIRNVTSPQCTSALIDLYVLSCNPDFTDRDFFGLKHSCHNAIKTISREDYELVQNAIHKIETDGDTNIQGALHDLLVSIIEEVKHIQDKPLDFESAKKAVMQINV